MGSFARFFVGVSCLALAGCALGSAEDGAGAETTVSSQVNSDVSADQSTESPSPTTTQELPPEEAAIMAAYHKLQEECMPAARSDPENAYRHLKPCSWGVYLDTFSTGIPKKLKEENVKTRGHHIIRAERPSSMTGDEAEIQDCMDSSGVFVYDVTTGKDKMVGPAQNSVLVTMKKVDGKWLVWAIVDAKDPLEYCAS